MIQQILLLLLMFLLGWTMTAPWFHYTQNRKLIPFFALFAGCSYYAILLFFILVIQGFTGWSINVSFLLLTLLSLALISFFLSRYRYIYNELNHYDWARLLFWAGIIVIGGIFFSYFNFAATSNDSHCYIQLGEGLALAGFKADGRFVSEGLLSSRPVFYSMFHALSRTFQIDYLWIFLPAYSAFFVFSFAWLIKDMVSSITGSIRLSLIFSFVAALLIVSSSFMIFNFYYINNHMFTGIHFTMFFLLAWRGLYFKSDKLVILATILLLPTVLMRFENILFVLIFAILLASFLPAGKTVRVIFSLSGICVAVISFLYFINLSGGGSGFISAAKMLQTGLAGILFAFLGSLIGRWNWSTNFWERIRTHVPYAILLAGVLVVARSFLFDFDTAGLSIPIMFYNMLDTNIWNHFWYLIIFLTILFWIIPDYTEYKYQLFLTGGILIFILFTIELSHLRDNPYRMGAGDSANRMMVHILPVILAHFAMAIANYLIKPKQEVAAEPQQEVYANTSVNTASST
jgi:hypothetical protein